jgi:hypothetical protein
VKSGINIEANMKAAWRRSEEAMKEKRKWQWRRRPVICVKPWLSVKAANNENIEIMSNRKK